MDEPDADTIDKLLHVDALLVVSATTGLGDLPENIFPFFFELKEKFPNLHKLKFGVIALGDSSYGDTFCGAGIMFDALLEELQANRVSPLLKIDALDTTDPFDFAESWVREWLVQL